MKIIQATDLHIGFEKQETYDVDVRANFLNLIPKVAEVNPDLAVLTGDFCFKEPEWEILKWIKDQLRSWTFPYCVITGNHDESAMLMNVFPQFPSEGTEELYYSMEARAHLLLFLDTKPGYMSPAQWLWLQNHLDNFSGPIIIFMHHPPIKAGVPHMDRRHDFKQSEEFRAIIKSTNNSVSIFCGHYHLERTLSMSEGAIIHITPSTVFQLDADRQDFGIEHYRPGYRVISLNDNEYRTWVKYI